jgi:glycosyltransferase involved in cell wall biosynthesis
MLNVVSVIIPCFNVQDYIEECLDSVVSQTYTNIEIICVDNYSKDKTWDKLNNLKEKYPQLVITKEKKNRRKIKSATSVKKIRSVFYLSTIRMKE